MQPSLGVVQGLMQFYDRFSANDVEGVRDRLSRSAHTIVIGTAPAEWYEGRDSWRDAFAEQVAAIPDIKIEPGNLQGWEDGDTGWGVDRPVFVLPDGTRVPVRLTAVLHREDGEWQMVHAHFSLGVPDELMPELLASAAS